MRKAKISKGTIEVIRKNRLAWYYINVLKMTFLKEVIGNTLNTVYLQNEVRDMVHKL